MNVNVNKGYKAYKKGLICEPDSKHRKQYAENTVFEEEGGKICGAGLMHYCLNPLDTLDYYPLIDSDGNMSEFTEVEALEQPVTDDGKKYAARKLKIGVKLSLPAFIKASFDFLWEKRSTDEPDSRVTAASGYNSKLAASGNYSKLAASGDDSKLAASGNYSKLAASGDDSKLAASGDYSKLAASGNYSKLAASGDDSKLAASGDDSKLAASGYNSKLAASGDDSKLAASGYNSKLAASGNYSKLAASGYNSKLAASGDDSKLAASGDDSKLAASGDYSKLAASGYNSKLAASGDDSKLAASGDDSIAAGIGVNNMAKASKGSWIVLAEWKYDGEKNTYIPICVKSVQVDGEKIKEDTFYRLKNGEFVEV